MRAVVPHTRRERPANYGDSQAVVADRKSPLFTMHKDHATELLLTVVCEEFIIPPAALNTGDFRPMVHIEWGNGASSVSADVDVTFRQRFPIVASSIDVQAFIASFPFPGVALAPAVPAGATARFRAFVGEGVDGVYPLATRWVTQFNQTTGVFAVGQARLATVRAFNPTANGAAEFFLLFDKGAAPAGGDVPFDGAPIPGFTANFGGLVPIPMGNTRAWINGISWGMSSTPFTFTGTGTKIFAVAELQQ